jgi:hypothetical protein
VRWNVRACSGRLGRPLSARLARESLLRRHRRCALAWASGAFPKRHRRVTRARLDLPQSTRCLEATVMFALLLAGCSPSFLVSPARYSSPQAAVQPRRALVSCHGGMAEAAKATGFVQTEMRGAHPTRREHALVADSTRRATPCNPRLPSRPHTPRALGVGCGCGMEGASRRRPFLRPHCALSRRPALCSLSRTRAQVRR